MKRYWLELGGAMVAYGGSLWLAQQAGGGLPSALIPLPAVLLVAWAVWRGIGRMDEMLRREATEALAVAFALTALLTFSYGFLEDAGLPRLSMFAVWPVMACSWIVAGVAVRMRHR